MKKNKFLLGLMIIPCLLASCNKSMGFDSAKKWVETHYKEISGGRRSAMPVLIWNFTNTKGDVAKGYISYIIEHIVSEAKTEFEFETEKESPIHVEPSGFINLVDSTAHIKQFNINSFTSAEDFTPLEGDIFKVNGDSLSIQYDRPFIDEKVPVEKLNSTSIRIYDNLGFCTQYAVKINKTINRDNVIKFKFYFNFIYEHDPIV